MSHFVSKYTKTRVYQYEICGNALEPVRGKLNPLETVHPISFDKACFSSHRPVKVSRNIIMYFFLC